MLRQIIDSMIKSSEVMDVIECELAKRELENKIASFQVEFTDGSKMTHTYPHKAKTNEWLTRLN